jgi:hypothetical protein
MAPGRLLAIMTLLAALAGGACGDDDGKQRSAPREGAVEGTGYSFVPPDGWEDSAELFEGGAIRFDAAYAESEPRAGFANNVNVIRETPPGLDADRLDELAEAMTRQVKPQATDAGLGPIDELELDDAPARSWTFERRVLERPRIRQQQVVAIHGDAVYTLTWSTRRAAFQRSRPDLQAMLDSWRWSD